MVIILLTSILAELNYCSLLRVYFKVYFHKLKKSVFD